jgi:hypothetical protein
MVPPRNLKECLWPTAREYIVELEDQRGRGAGACVMAPIVALLGWLGAHIANRLRSWATRRERIGGHAGAR